MRKINTLVFITAAVLITAVIGHLIHKKQLDQAVITAGAYQAPLTSAQIKALTDNQSLLPIGQLTDDKESNEYTAKTPLIPSSLAGLPLPASFDIDADGHLIINDKILSAFEFYFSALGEEDLPFITTRVNHFLITSLKSPALERAQNIFKNYLGYLNHLTIIKSEYEHTATSLESLALAKNELLQVREQFFSNEVIQEFWGKSDQYEQYMLALASIKNDSSITLQEEQQAIDNLNTLTPSWLITQQETANKLNDYRIKYQQLKDSGTDSQTLNEFNEQEFGELAAQRLTALQQQRQQWQERVTQYKNELQQLIALSLTTEDFNNQRDQLRQIHFNTQETKRIKALDSHFSTSPIF